MLFIRHTRKTWNRFTNLESVLPETVGGGGVLQLDPLLETGVAVPRVAPRTQPPRSDLGVDLFHDLAEVRRGEGFDAVVVAILAGK